MGCSLSEDKNGGESIVVVDDVPEPSPGSDEDSAGGSDQDLKNAGKEEPLRVKSQAFCCGETLFRKPCHCSLLPGREGSTHR